MFDRLTNLAGLIAFATALSLSVPVIAADNYIVGVVPQFATQIISSTWEPLLEELAAKTGDTFELVIETDITQFEVAFERGNRSRYRITTESRSLSGSERHTTRASN